MQKHIIFITREKGRQHVPASGRCGDCRNLGTDSCFLPVRLWPVCQGCFCGGAGDSDRLGGLSVLFCVRLSGGLCLGNSWNRESAACHGNHCGQHVSGAYLRSERNPALPAKCGGCGGGLPHHMGVYGGVPVPVLPKRPVDSSNEREKNEENPLRRTLQKFFSMGFPQSRKKCAFVCRLT